MNPDRPACRETREGLTEYLENALPPDERQGVESHLASCAACARLLDQLRATIDTLPALPSEAMPAETKRRLRQAFRDRNGRAL